jgi:hypothetical protein
MLDMFGVMQIPLEQETGSQNVSAFGGHKGCVSQQPTRDEFAKTVTQGSVMPHVVKLKATGTQPVAGLQVWVVQLLMAGHTVVELRSHNPLVSLQVYITHASTRHVTLAHLLRGTHLVVLTAWHTPLVQTPLKQGFSAACCCAQTAFMSM